LNTLEPRASLFSSVETIVEALERQALPLAQQRSLTERALRALDLVARNTQTLPERQQIAGYIYRFAQTAEQWTFASEAVAESFAWAAAIFFEPEASAAELLLRRAVGIWERLYSPTDERVLTALHNLAALAEQSENYEEAEELLQRVITARAKAQPAEQGEIAVSLHNLAHLYALQEKREEAEALYRKALEMGEQAWGTEHPFIFTVLYNLALLYAQWLTLPEALQLDMADRLAESEALLRRVYAHWQNASGIEDLAATRVLHQLALVFLGQEKWAEAEAAFQRTQANYERLLGSDNLELATCLEQMAVCFQQQQRVNEATEALQNALEIRECVLGTPQHPDLASALNNLATLYAMQKRFDEAETLVTRAQNICLQAFGAEHPTQVFTLNTRILLSTMAGNVSEAATRLGQMVALLAELFGQDAPETQNMRAQYQEVLAELSKG
jgi:tetratricopeptide (TPR) repeat protein